jgi:hypothetical protein
MGAFYAYVLFLAFPLCAFREEIHPISPMAMFFRQHPSEEGRARLAKLRAPLERDGLFPARTDWTKVKGRRHRSN